GREHLSVLAVSQERIGEPRTTQHLLGCQVVRDDERGTVRMYSNTGRIHDVAHARGNRRVDRRLVLPPAALTDIQRADEQNLLATGECRDQRVRVVEVGVANTRTARAEGRKRGGSARRQYQLCRWHFLQQGLCDHLAECARGACDDDAHEGSCPKAPARLPRTQENSIPG